MKLKRKLSVAIGVVFSLVAILGIAQPASAATKTFTISVGDWNCIQGGRYKGTVSKVLIDVVPSKSGAASWKSGRTRDVVVSYNTYGSKATIAAVVFCKTNWFGAGYYRQISAARWVDRNTSTYWNI